MIVACVLLLLFLLLLVWTCCTRTLCFRPKNRNSNVVRGNTGQTNSSQGSKKKTSQTSKLQKRDIKLVEDSIRDQYQENQVNTRNTEPIGTQPRSTGEYDNSLPRDGYPGYVLGRMPQSVRFRFILNRFILKF